MLSILQGHKCFSRRHIILHLQSEGGVLNPKRVEGKEPEKQKYEETCNNCSIYACGKENF